MYVIVLNLPTKTVPKTLKLLDKTKRDFMKWAEKNGLVLRPYEYLTLIYWVQGLQTGQQETKGEAACNFLPACQVYQRGNSADERGCGQGNRRPTIQRKRSDLPATQPTVA